MFMAIFRGPGDSLFRDAIPLMYSIRQFSTTSHLGKGVAGKPKGLTELQRLIEIPKDIGYLGKSIKERLSNTNLRNDYPSDIKRNKRFAEYLESTQILVRHL